MNRNLPYPRVLVINTSKTKTHPGALTLTGAKQKGKRRSRGGLATYLLSLMHIMTHHAAPMYGALNRVFGILLLP